jgi:hypothetical protein
MLSLLWQPTRWPMSIEEMDAEEPGVPAVPAGVALVGRQRKREGGAVRTYWTFEGVMGNGKDVTFKQRGNSPDFGFQGGFAQVDIGKHPQFQALLAAYSGSIVDGQVYFPPTYTPGGSTKAQANPMFGQTDFLRLDGIYTYRYAALSLSGLGGSVGKIITNPPGQAPSYSSRNYLAAPLIYRHRGTIYDVQEPYWLSGEGGWPKPIYGGNVTGSAGGSSFSAGSSDLAGGSLFSGAFESNLGAEAGAGALPFS